MSRFYGGDGWTELTAVIDATFDSVAVVPDLSDLGQVLSFDRLWVDQRWVVGVLTDQELANIAAFINTGRRVVMIGENHTWEDWNNQILGLVGGSHVGQSSDTANPLNVPPLTDGVGPIILDRAGVASGGTALFDINWSTLWGDNVVTALDINVWDDIHWGGSNAQFGNNVVEWLAVPAPATLTLLGVAGLIGSRRRRR